MNSCKRGDGLSPAGLDLDGDEVASIKIIADFKITKLGQTEYPVMGGTQKAWDIQGDGPRETIRVSQEWYERFRPVLGGYILWRNAPGKILMPVYSPSLEYVEPPKPLDFSRLNKIMVYSSGQGALSLFQTFTVFTKRHGGGYCAALLKHEDLVGETQEIFAEDWGYEHLLQQRPWYPYRLGRSAEEAMGALLTFLNEELTHDREELITWAGNCAALEYYLYRGQDGCFQGGTGMLPEDWVLTYNEAIGRKPL
jgi:hypothetical protein